MQYLINNHRNIKADRDTPKLFSQRMLNNAKIKIIKS